METDDTKTKTKTAAVCESCGKVTSAYVRTDGTIRPIGWRSDAGGDSGRGGCGDGSGDEHDFQVLNPTVADDTPIGGNENPI